MHRLTITTHPALYLAFTTAEEALQVAQLIKQEKESTQSYFSTIATQFGSTFVHDYRQAVKIAEEQLNLDKNDPYHRLLFEYRPAELQ
jgi:hypothetical protein